MEDFFTDSDHTHTQPQFSNDQPFIQQDPQQPIITQQYEQPFEFNYPQSDLQPQSFSNPQDENEFNDFEEDETARRIREEEERIQGTLREKSQREWQDKQKRKEEGRQQLEEFVTRKEEEKSQRARDNLRKETELKEQHAKLNVQAGWKKVTTNINMRQGERTGPKDTNRMREAILHRREDDKR